MTFPDSPLPAGRRPTLDRASRIRRAPTRRRIIQAATKVMATCGYSKLSVAQVIEQAGISRSTFYEHFTNRDDCFLACLDHLGNELIERLEAVERSDTSGAYALIEALCEHVRDDPVAARVLFVESLAGGPAALDRRERLRRQTALLIAVASQTGLRPDGEQTLPAALDDLIGGLFRLFPMRLRRSPGASELCPADLAAWFASYAGVFAMSSRDLFAQPAQPDLGPTQPYGLKPLTGGRHRLSEAEVAMSQRLRIYSSITRLGRDLGYAHTSVTEITATARVSRNAFYRHFRSKPDAANQALELIVEQLIGACAAAFTSASHWPEKVWRAGEAFASFFITTPDHAHLGLVETHAVGDEMAQLVYDRLGAFALFLEEGYRWRPQAAQLPRICSDAIGATMYEIAFRALRELHRPGWHSDFLSRFGLICIAPFMGHEAAMKFVAEKGALLDRGQAPARRDLAQPAGTR